MRASRAGDLMHALVRQAEQRRRVALAEAKILEQPAKRRERRALRLFVEALGARASVAAPLEGGANGGGQAHVIDETTARAFRSFHPSSSQTASAERIRRRDSSIVRPCVWQPFTAGMVATHQPSESRS